MQELNIDEEFKSLIPHLSTEEYNQLEENIKLEGCRDPLVVWNSFIIDGHNRYSICSKHNIDYEVVIKDELQAREDVIAWIIKNQFGRRNLPNYERARLALKLENVFKGKAKENQGIRSDICLKSDKSIKPIDTKKELAKIAGVGHDTIAKVKKIEEKAPEEVKHQLATGEISINQAHKEIVKQEKKEEHKQNIQMQKEAISKGEAKLPDGVFEVIAIDPPWNYGREYDPDGSRVANPYPEMNQEDLKALEIPSAKDSVMFLWTTHKFIFDAKELLDTWGFEYKATMVWNKEKIGMGAWLRMQCEFCLVGIKGKPIWENTTWRDVISEPRREHSRKPEAFYQMVDEITVGRKLEYFSRTKREGWEIFGNDTDKFEAVS